MEGDNFLSISSMPQMFLEICVYMCKGNAKPSRYVHCPMGSLIMVRCIISYKKSSNVCHYKKEMQEKNDEVEE